MEGSGESGVIVAVKEAQRRSFNGRNDDVDGAGGELEERRGALLLHIGVGREIFKGEDIVRWKTHDARGVDCTGKFTGCLEGDLQSFGHLVVRDDDNHRPASGSSHEGQVQGASGGGESGHTTAPRSKAQVPAYALKCRTMLQFRENFADKRENHCSLSLAVRKKGCIAV